MNDWADNQDLHGTILPPPAISPVRFQPSSCDLQAAAVMIVDDEPVNIKVLRKYLQMAGYSNFVTTTESREAVDLIRDRKPDVVLLDVMMPHVDGLAILQAVRSDERLQFVPIIIVTASDDDKTKLTALELGATDFLAKPVDSNDLLPRVRNALILKAYQNHLENYSAHLEQQVQRRTAKLQASRMHVIHCLARAAEYRDDVTGNHVIRVGLYAGIVARQLGLANEGVSLLEQAAQLHDVGKIGIADSILHKPSKLSADEFKRMQKHCQMGRDIIMASPSSTNSFGRMQDIVNQDNGATIGRAGEKLRDDIVPAPNLEERVRIEEAQATAMIADLDDSPVLTMAGVIAMTHHEKWDGSGYPLGLSRNDIPIEGRMVAIADVYDALSSKRPYKDAFSQEKCLGIIEESRGTHFDPKMVDAFLRGFEQIVQVQNQYGDKVN